MSSGHRCTQTNIAKTHTSIAKTQTSIAKTHASIEPQHEQCPQVEVKVRPDTLGLIPM